MTSSVATTSSKLPADAELPNRDHITGHAMAEKTPARAAVHGVGVIFTDDADH